MAQSYPFKRQTAEDLIVVTAQIGQSIVDLVIDTGASHTFIDFGILIKEGFRLSDSKKLLPIETANGIMYANTFDVAFVRAIGIEKRNFEITSYLFDNPQSDFKGVLGLDFLGDSEICINFRTSILTLKPIR